jgi:hypothetical protein
VFCVQEPLADFREEATTFIVAFSLASGIAHQVVVPLVYWYTQVLEEVFNRSIGRALEQVILGLYILDVLLLNLSYTCCVSGLPGFVRGLKARALVAPKLRYVVVLWIVVLSGVHGHSEESEVALCVVELDAELVEICQLVADHQAFSHEEARLHVNFVLLAPPSFVRFQDLQILRLRSARKYELCLLEVTVKLLQVWCCHLMWEVFYLYKILLLLKTGGFSVAVGSVKDEHLGLNEIGCQVSNCLVLIVEIVYLPRRTEFAQFFKIFVKIRVLNELKREIEVKVGHVYRILVLVFFHLKRHDSLRFYESFFL